MQMPVKAEPDLSDDRLMALYAGGDAAAARVLTDRFLPRAYATACRLLADAGDAEDVAQEAMIRLWHIAPKWEPGRARVSTWLHRVVSNLCIDRMRKRRSMSPMPKDIADDRPSVTDDLQAAERKQRLLDALAKLPERQRLAVEMRLLEGFSNPQIAAELGVSVAAVESLTARGKRALTHSLSHQRATLGYER